MKRCRLAALLLVACPSGAAVADTSSRGSIAVEGRAFVPDEHESTEDYGVAVTSSVRSGRSTPSHDGACLAIQTSIPYAIGSSCQSDY